jgi:glycosyltransferase involved in cell wall biosynthesis
VIPNKVFDGLAMARPVITGDVPAVRDALRDREEIWLVPLADPPALAQAIQTLRHDTPLRDAVGRAGNAAFRRQFSIEAISERLSEVLGEVMETRR